LSYLRLSSNPNAAAKPGLLRVERTVMVIDGVLSYDTPKTRGSRHRVPLPPVTVAVLRDYLAAHPRHDEAAAPLFPACALVPIKPTGRGATDATGQRTVATADEALAALSAQDAEDRLTLGWSVPMRHGSFYKAVYRPAVLRANLASTQATDALPPFLRFHALRHTYASLCVAAGLPALAIAKFMGYAKVTTTLTVCAHLFEDDHADAMAALGSMATPRGRQRTWCRSVGARRGQPHTGGSGTPHNCLPRRQSPGNLTASETTNPSDSSASATNDSKASTRSGRYGDERGTVGELTPTGAYLRAGDGNRTRVISLED